MNYLKKHPSLLLNTAVLAVGITALIDGIPRTQPVEIVMGALASLFTIWQLIQGTREAVRDERGAQITQQYNQEHAEMAYRNSLMGWEQIQYDDQMKKIQDKYGEG